MDKINTRNDLFASNMWAVFNFDDTNKRYQLLHKNVNNLKIFLENILLHDTIYIPTQDFLSLVYLIDVLGDQNVIELLTAEHIKFIRLKGALGYYGNGSGIQPIHVKKPDKKTPAHFCAPIDETLKWALGGLYKSYDPIIEKKVLETTLELASKNIVSEIKETTYTDILSTNYLRNIFAIRNKDLNHLHGIDPNQVKIYGGKDFSEWKGSEVDLTLLLAHINLEIYLMKVSNCKDISSYNPIANIFQAKVNKYYKENLSHQSFLVLKEIENIPDIGEFILLDTNNLKNLLKLKKSKSGTDFRYWFHNNIHNESKSITIEYCKLLKEISIINKMPAKIIRFLITSLSSLIPIAGSIISPTFGIIDTFFLEKISANKKSPIIFFNSIKDVFKK